MKQRARERETERERERKKNRDRLLLAHKTETVFFGSLFINIFGGFPAHRGSMPLAARPAHGRYRRPVTAARCYVLMVGELLWFVLFWLFAWWVGCLGGRLVCLFVWLVDSFIACFVSSCRRNGTFSTRLRPTFSAIGGGGHPCPCLRGGGHVWKDS